MSEHLLEHTTLPTDTTEDHRKVLQATAAQGRDPATAECYWIEYTVAIDGPDGEPIGVETRRLPMIKTGKWPAPRKEAP